MGLEHPLSCRAMTLYERCLATHDVALGCKLKFTLLELVVPTIYHAAHKHGFTLASFRARGKDPTLHQWRIQVS